MNPLRRLFSGRRKSARRARSQQQPAEVLENRCLLAGDISVTMNGNNLIIEGDDGDNAFEVTYFDGDIAIRSREGTRINGETGKYVAIADSNTIAGHLVLKLGKGDDTAIITRGFTVGGDVRVEGGAGNDTLGVLRPTINGELRAVMGSGRDSIVVEETTIGTTTNLKGNNGPDTIAIRSTTVANRALISTSGGDDSIVIADSVFATDLDLSTGSHDDAVAIEATRVEANLDVVTVGGNDIMQMIDSRVEGTSFIGMGSNDDELSLGESGKRNVFVGDFRTNGSGGDDTYDQKNNVFQGSRDVERFDEGTIELDDIVSAVADADQIEGDVAQLFVYSEQDITGIPDESQQSVGTHITTVQTPNLVGTATNDAWVTVDVDDDGQFDDGSGRADEFGNFAIDVALQPGRQILKYKAVDESGTETMGEVDVHYAVGSVAEFNTSLGPFHVEMLDEDAPLTVANYKNYFDSYTNALVHRSINNFVIQGGGFEYVNGQIQTIQTNPPVENEFNEANSNLRGTLSTALAGGDFDSATNQWFINLVDNTHLDAARHTVFGRVIGDGMDTVDAISQLEIFNLDNGVFQNTPLRDYSIFSRELTGTVSITQGQTILTGTDTLFTEELVPGNRLRFIEDGEVVGDYTVSSIISDTQLSLTSVASEDITNAEARTHDEITEENFTFANIDEILE